MVTCDTKLPYKIFNLKMKNKIKEEASNGHYNKWKMRVGTGEDVKYIWIKSGDYIFNNYNHEGIMEVVASNLTIDLGIKDVTRYYPCVLNIEELDGSITRSIGCYSFQFTNEDEEVVTFRDLGTDYYNYGNVIKRTAEKTGISEDDIRDYIDRCLLIDGLIFNPDRHFDNLAVIKNQITGKYRLCPVFDFGLALDGLATLHVQIQDYCDPEASNYQAKPFCARHDAQLKLTHFKDSIEGKIELLHMKNNSISNTLNIINRMFACFGYDYLNTWDVNQRTKAEELREVYQVELPMLLSEQQYITSVIKRRIEVVLGGVPINDRIGQETIDRMYDQVSHTRYVKGD